ncbi:MAG: NADH-ubiquinone oxidoreductase-F iron-sulfur binding region domain-containing protein [Desulfobacteraceae bacterium]
MRPGSTFKMCQTGGASGSGTMLVLDQSVSAVDFARCVAIFFAHESCGQCTPCRESTPLILNTLTRIWEGRGQPGDLELLERLGKVMVDASFCPLGQTAPAPLMSLLKHFRQEFEDHIQGKCKKRVYNSG